ncbi:hypothetical protein MVEN_02424300 [Mycena venus]|uniref:Macrofage activating glycoprotein n=1 Tax=Mycena venus TaxID=2733690 RepID=A0A8H7CAS8_9AGAR|nr:hypothetical protein MVEN_02424300 [Mycena venus]
MFSALFIALSLIFVVKADHIYSATYLPSNIPEQTEDGQSGTNQCGTSVNQSSLCQTAYMNAVDDWRAFSCSFLWTASINFAGRCLWAPPEPGPGSTIGETERIEVAWCIKNGTGARLIPDGAIKGAHWLITPDYIQVTGVGDMTKLNIPADDEGGELDPHGADGNGNPVGGIVFSNAFGGQVEEIFEWTNFMGENNFCFRICDPKGSNPAAYCQHIYDVLGCEWNMPANYDEGFDSCHADSGEPMGVYGTSTFHQGDGATPDPHPAPKPTSCSTVSTIGNGFLIDGTSILAVPSAKPTTSGSVTSSGRSGSTAKPTGSASRSTSGTAVGPTASSNSAGASSWERRILGLWSALGLSLVGAVTVLI